MKSPTIIKIDRTTLPKDGQRIRFSTYEEEDLIGQFSEGDDLFVITPTKWYSAFDVHTWELLKTDSGE